MQGARAAHATRIAASDIPEIRYRIVLCAPSKRRPRKPNVTETYRANSSFPLGSAAALSGL